jgi:hypothetical protein
MKRIQIILINSGIPVAQGISSSSFVILTNGPPSTPALPCAVIKNPLGGLEKYKNKIKYKTVDIRIKQIAGRRGVF